MIPADTIGDKEEYRVHSKASTTWETFFRTVREDDSMFRVLEPWKGQLKSVLLLNFHNRLSTRRHSEAATGKQPGQLINRCFLSPGLSSKMLYTHMPGSDTRCCVRSTVTFMKKLNRKIWSFIPTVHHSSLPLANDPSLHLQP